MCTAVKASTVPSRFAVVTFFVVVDSFFCSQVRSDRRSKEKTPSVLRHLDVQCNHVVMLKEKNKKKTITKEKGGHSLKAESMVSNIFLFYSLDTPPPFTTGGLCVRSLLAEGSFGRELS